MGTKYEIYVWRKAGLSKEYKWVYFWSGNSFYNLIYWIINAKQNLGCPVQITWR